MKSAQIAVGVSYEDKGMTTIRKVVATYEATGGAKMVQYTERSAHEYSRPPYWPLERPREMPLAKFAAWAARPAGAKDPFKNWKGGVEHQFAKNG